MDKLKGLADMRREYVVPSSFSAHVDACPISQFERWFAEIVTTEVTEPNVMVLSTVDKQGHPDSRVVLLKGVDAGRFIFYTNYRSTKAMQIKAMPYVALNFYWPNAARQVRIRGSIERTSKQQSDAYFSARPVASQFGSIVSPQSTEISCRDDLENALNALIKAHDGTLIERPDHWGGYQVMPEHIEFMQGRESRLHERIHYYKKSGEWVHRHLAP